MNNFTTFLDLINCVNIPLELKELIEKCKNTPQTLEWHPEFFVYNHIEIVYDRALQTNDPDMIMCAFFHDLGKVEATKPHATKPNTWPAHGHEHISAKLVLKYKDWIESYSANSDNVYYLVKNHMRIKQIDVMRKSKQDALRQHNLFNKLLQFSEFDNMLNL